VPDFPSTRSIRLRRLSDGAYASARDELAVEEPLELRVEGRSLAVVMRTPGHDRELAAGFLLTEGIVKSAAEIFDITHCVASGSLAKGNVIDVGLVRPDSVDLRKLTRHVFTSSSCGICGKTSIDAVLGHRKALKSRLRVSPELILGLPHELAKQGAFSRTGVLHACALFAQDGTLQLVREDVGRHNALDKLVGWAMLEKRLPLSESLLLLSGRASFEMMQKAHAAGLCVIAAISAPSSLAVEFAKESGQTLIGGIRKQSMNIYAGGRWIASGMATKRC
jgi:FdhD protein